MMGPSHSTGSEGTLRDPAGPVLARCRPGPPLWILAGIFGLVGGLTVAIPAEPAADAAGRWFYWCLGAAFLAPALTLVYWLLRAEVIAEGTGLRWRGLGSWRGARWAQVSDYYEKPFPRGKQLVVETSIGTIKLTEAGWSGLHRLRLAVERQATSALTKSWATLGTRPEERWPLIFRYARADELTAAVVLGLGGLAAAGAAVQLFTPAHLRGIMDMAQNLGWPLGVLAGVFWVGFGLILPAMLLPLGLIYGQMRRRRGHRIVTAAEGITFESGSDRIAANWSEVADYFRAPLPGWLCFGVCHVVNTAQGSFDFTSLMRDALILERVIADHARSAQASEWRTRTDIEEMLGGAAPRRGRDAHGDQERLYHYRTRTNRALLWFLTALALMHALVPELMSPASLQPPRGSAGPLFDGVTVFLALWGWWRYHSASVRTSARGITQCTLFGRRSIRWDQVQNYHEAGADVWTFGIVAGEKTRIWFSLGIGHVEELKDEIARRAVNARGSKWKQKAPARRIG
jgi:hypothetical protein